MPDSAQHLGPSRNDLLVHYDNGNEDQRLNKGKGKIELARMHELFDRFLPGAPAEILDVGGGSGVHAIWLAQRGYVVDLVDLVAKHVNQALEASQKQLHHPLRSASVGDALSLSSWPNDGFDAVLLLGPLYHLTEYENRISALREACRVVRPGGVVLISTISRFASALSGIFRCLLDDPSFQDIVNRDLMNGQHRNPSNHPRYFTTSYFHHPGEIKGEVEEAGLVFEDNIAVEGPSWLLQNLDEYWDDNTRRENLLDMLRKLESEPSLIGASAHVLTVSRKSLRDVGEGIRDITEAEKEEAHL